MKSINGAVIVSWSLTDGTDDSVLIVGEQVNNKIEILNAFQGRKLMRYIINSLTQRYL